MQQHCRQYWIAAVWSWCQLPLLFSCQCSHQNVAGTLPDAWWQLSALAGLELSGNDLTGTLPASWEGMQNLTSLRLSFNRLRRVPSCMPVCLPNFHVCCYCMPHLSANAKDMGLCRRKVQTDRALSQVVKHR